MEVESEGEDDEESDEDDREIARAARPMTDGVSQDMEESEEDSEEEDETPRGRLAPPPPPPPPPPKEAPPPPLPPAPERVVIKKDYNPKDSHSTQKFERKIEQGSEPPQRVAYAQIDWHDFVVVETVDFQPTEIGNLPPPTTPEEVGARILQMERFVRGEIPVS
uniref:Splicing factor 3A subunit 1 conserved domain-containing protein n=1 Tax=Biomphalaria glabrata TaxID=6526 RepID=A0A2C9L908_BIOGL